MTTPLSIEVPFPVFQDRDGQPLENGYIWLGVPNLNPQVNPVIAYFDEALTIVAPQPLRTLNGYISNSGTPAKVYIDGNNFSILVQDSKGSMVYNFASGTGAEPIPSDACGILYDPPFPNSVTYPVCEKLAQYVSVKDFGAVGDGVADDTIAIQAAINACFGSPSSPNGNTNRSLNKALFIPNGIYLLTDSLNIRALRGGMVYGDGRFATTLRQTTANKAVFSTNGCDYSVFSDMHLECTQPNSGAIFDLTWDSTGGVALQSNTFRNMYFTGRSDLTVANGLRIGQGGFMGSENIIENCFFIYCGRGLSIQNFNALQNIVIGGNFQACRVGIRVLAGSVTNIYGVGFQNDIFSSGNNQVTENGFDIEVLNSANDSMVVEGCRTESMRFFSGGNRINAKLSNNTINPSRIQPWASNRVYSLGAIVSAAGAPYICTTAGTSGGAEPIWSGATITDNTVVWTEYNYNVAQGATTYDSNICPYGQIPGQVATATLFIRNFFSRSDYLALPQAYQNINTSPIQINNTVQFPYQTGSPSPPAQFRPGWTPLFVTDLGLTALAFSGFNGLQVGFERAKIDAFSTQQNSIGVEGALSGRSVSGTDQAGKTLFLAGGAGTGNATPGTIVFSTSTATSSGTTVQNFSTRMTLKSSGVLNLNATPTYADNTAAIAGGLVVNDVYKTATGELRIVV